MFRGMVSFLGVAVATFMMAVSGVNSVFAQEGKEVKALIEALEVGDSIYYENLTIIPVYTNKLKDRTSYTTLDEALKYHWLEVTELEGGQVPQVRLTNLSDKYIYIMGGEIITGCKQDRLVGRDVLIGPKSKNIVVPVYCVEQGRWTYQSDKFYSKEKLGTWDLRAQGQMAEQSSQSNIWHKVSRINKSMNVQSHSDAYQAAYDSEPVRQKIAGFECRMQNIPQLHTDTVGVIVAVGEKIVSVDIFANPSLFKKIWPKLLKSSALAAISSDTAGSVSQEEAAEFLRNLHDKDFVQKSAVSLGAEFSAIDDEVNANVLTYRSAVIHLAGFSQEGKGYSAKINPDNERRIPVMRRQ
ncbi:MAG: hypothetical protein Q8O30_00265 [Candidatus Omnitrophota bacterium]|nr:hypothetical protein [Candidatus Omnitrophota bacterium]